MTLNGYKFEFCPKFALSNFKRIRQVAALSRVTLASAGLSCWIKVMVLVVKVKCKILRFQGILKTANKVS